MAIERKEPTISSGSSSSASPVPPPSSKKINPGSQGPKSAPKVIVQKVSSGFLWFTFLLTLLVAGGVGYSVWQLQMSQQLIGAQQKRIDELENKLLLTGDESTQSLTAVTANLKELDKDVKLALSEVDKLWATRNVNLKSIEELKQSLGSAVADIKKNSQAVAGIDAKIEKPLASMERRTGEQELLIQSLRERLSEQDKKTQSLQAQIKQFASASKQVDAISSKVDGYEETIRSFDKFRITTNRDLLLLKERAGVLSAPAR